MPRFRCIDRGTLPTSGSGWRHVSTRNDGPVDAYLDELFDRLAGTGAAGWRALTEAQDHLAAAAADERQRGLDELAAGWRPAAGPARAGGTAPGPAAWGIAGVRQPRCVT